MSGWASDAIERLMRGEAVVVRPRGHSMEPLIRSGEAVYLHPTHVGAPLERGDIVLARVRGRVYLHLVKAIVGGRVLIGNNRGGTNGWTSAVYGRVHRKCPHDPTFLKPRWKRYGKGDR